MRTRASCWTMSKIYFDDGPLLIRSMLPEDTDILYDTYFSYGWHPRRDTYTGYWREQEAGRRLVFIPVYQGAIAGQCTLRLDPDGGPWAHRGIPEIDDLTVFFHLHHQGIGSRLLDAAEREAAKLCDTVCLAVGLHSGYGPAQRLYARRGYLPDGSGVWYQGKPLAQYAPCSNDDDLLLYLSKALK